MKRAESSRELAQCFKHSADNEGENEIINGSLQTQPDFFFPLPSQKSLLVPVGSSEWGYSARKTAAVGEAADKNK